MDKDPISRPSSTVPRAPTARGRRSPSKKNATRNSPYPSRAPTPAPIMADTEEEEEFHYLPDSRCDEITHLLDILPPAFALDSLPSTAEIRDFSAGELIIIPLLCSITKSLSARPRQPPPPTANSLAALEASVANLNARMAPPPPAPTARATNTIPPAPAPTFAKVAAAGAPPPGPQNNTQPMKKGKKKGATAAEVAIASAETPRAKGPTTIPTAARRFFAPRTDPAPHPDSLQIIRSLPDVAANALHDANCPFPLSFTALCNRKGSVTLLVNSPSTPASSYSPYFDLLSVRLNQAFPIGSNPFLPFRLAPCVA